MHSSAMLAATQILVAVERLKNRRQVLYQALQADFCPVYELVTVRAVPFERVQRAVRTWHFDYETDRVGSALRRMTHVLRKQEDLAFANRNIHWRLACLWHRANDDVAL